MGRRTRAQSWLREAWLAGLFALICGVLSAASAQAQMAPLVRSAVDARGVDLMSGSFNLATSDVSIGKPGAGGLAYGRILSGPNLSCLTCGTIMTVSGVATVSIGNHSEAFTVAGGVYTPTYGQGSSLSFNATTGVYTYTSPDGAVALFSALPSGAISITSLTKPNGEVDTFTYNASSQLTSVNNNFGYQLFFTYSGATFVVTAINNAVDYCSPTATSCTFTVTWPSATYASTGSSTTVTDALSRATVYHYTTFGGVLYVTSIVLPSGATKTIGYNGSHQVSSVSNGVGTWTYGYSMSGSVETTTVTDPLGHTNVAVSDLTMPKLTSFTDGLSRTTSFTYDTAGRPTQVTAPEGDAVQYAYDARGNVTTTTKVPKSGSGLSNIVTTANYDTTCVLIVKCNKPNSVVDALSNQTDYTYDSSTGALLTVTSPAATSGAVRPQTRTTYSSLYAWYYTTSGSIAQAATSISLPTATSTCVSTASCSGTADEVKTTIAYGTSGVANNLLPTSISKGSGDGLLTATAITTYDPVGNTLTVTPPLGSSETTRYRYDADRELVGVVGPDPDGAGSLLFPATRNTYNADGLVTVTEQGTVNSQSDADWAAFSTLEQVATTYDSIDRKVSTSQASGGTTQTLSQISYDNANRVTCTALRMNPAIFASEPSSACTLGTAGANGNDRIVSNTYDAADELTQITTAYGTSVQANYETKTYSNDGLVQTILDGKNNLTTYTYDGVNRLSQTSFPVATQGADASNASDYESLTYDAGSNVLTDRKRDASTLTYTYDNLNRVTQKAPSVGGTTVNYTYDLLSRRTSSLYASSGVGVSSTFDALGRRISVTEAGLTLGYQYDIGGNLTQLTWPDSFYATYAYDALNRMTTIQDSSGGMTGAYITYSYDNLGRRTQMARGNSTSTTYGYDGADRLNSLAQTLVGTTSVTFGASFSPASQILSLSSTNSAYVSHPSSTATAYVTNGLNQYASVGGTSFTYDSKGNLTSDGTRSFTYDVENRLLTETGGAQNVTLTYDPLGRLQQTVGSATTQFLYAGKKLIAEYDGSGTLLRRYVPGAGGDEPVLWYEGSGFTDRRWLHSDYHGSIIAYSDGTGAAAATYGYGAYGEPNSWAGSRYRYTGQIEIPEAQLYYYKARVYDPTLGRFLQTDPIGYDSDVNSYAYASNDPMNGTDSSGMIGLDAAGSTIVQSLGDIDPIVVTAAIQLPSLDSCVPCAGLNSQLLAGLNPSISVSIPSVNVNIPSTTAVALTPTDPSPDSTAAQPQCSDPYGCVSITRNKPEVVARQILNIYDLNPFSPRFALSVIQALTPPSKTCPAAVAALAAAQSKFDLDGQKTYDAAQATLDARTDRDPYTTPGLTVATGILTGSLAQDGVALDQAKQNVAGC